MTEPGGSVGGISPAVVWASAAWMGALAGWSAVDVRGAFDPRAAATPAIVVAAIVVALGAGRWQCRRRRRHVDRGCVPPGPAFATVGATIVGTVVVAVALAGLAGQRRAALATGPLVALAADGGEAWIEATVASEPAMREDGTAWSLVTVTRVDADVGRWRALVSDQTDPAPVGSRLRLRASARPLADDGFDGYLRRRHAVVALHPSVAEVAAPPQGVLGAVEEVRSRIRAAARVGLAGDAAGLAVGLVTGDTRLLSHAGQDAMQATGLTHLVAVSGSNVALVAGVVAGLAGAAPARLRRAAVLGSILVFAITTRAEPSVLRAAVMAVVVMGATMVGRPRAALHALAVAVIVLLVADPAAAGSLGLALSALATLGVLVVAPVFALRLPAWVPRPVALLLAATLGAQVAVAPVLVAGIGDVPLAAIPANMVAVPAAAVASLVAVVAALVAQVHQGMGGGIMAVAGPPLHVVLTVAHRGDVGPVLSLASPVGLAVATAATVAVLARPRTRPRRVAVVVTGVLAAVTLAPSPGSPGAPPGVLAVTAIDVGQGDALLVTTASGHRMLVDTGRDERAAQWLRRNGVTRLDLVVVTHADDDHAGGLDDVLATVEAPVVWVSARPDGNPEPPGGVLPPGTVAVVANTSAVLGSARIDVLGPPAGHDLVATEGGRNDRSVVLRIVEGDRVALLTGDIEHAAQRWLLQSGADVTTGMLAVPHHGAATSVPAFLEATAAVVAVVSVGADNDYGHPRQAVLDVLDDMGTELHRTDLDGTVTVPVPPPR